MKICILTPKFPPDIGGLSISVSRFVNILSQDGNEVIVIVPDKSLIFHEKRSTYFPCDNNGSLKIVRFGVSDKETLTKQFCFEICCELAPFDLIHGFYLSIMGFTTVFSARYLNIPSIVSARGNDIDRDIFDNNKHANILWTIENATAITSNTKDIIKKINSLVPNKKVFYTPNSVNTDIFKVKNKSKEIIKQFEFNIKEPLIGFVGECRLKKGLPTLLESLKILKKKYNNIQFILLGGIRKSDEKLFEIFLKQNPELIKNIKIIPYQKHELLPDFYNLFDLVILPSYQDGLPNTLLEAMSCEKIVIGTSVGGIKDIIKNMETGILIPPYQTEKLVQAIDNVLSDKDNMNIIGKKARNYIISNHSFQHELESFKRCYDFVT